MGKGMDALTNAALDKLMRESLPRVASLLAELARTPAATRMPSPGLATACGEAMELLAMLRRWSGGALDAATTARLGLSGQTAVARAGHATPAGEPELDAGEAAMMMAAMASESAAPRPEDELGADDAAMLMAVLEADGPTGDASRADSVSDAGSQARLAAQDAPLAAGADMSDAEARALLAAMDAPSATSGAEEISDEDARARLAAMDAPVAATAAGADMSDAEARALLAAMDAPAAAGGAESEISDQEARALLAAMDAPAAVDAAGGDMSDAEARALLAAMDAPANASAASATASPTKAAAAETVAQAPSPAAVTVGTAPTAAVSAANPASAAAVVGAPHAPSAAHATGHGDVADVAEINEWEPNDFQTDPDMINDFLANSDQLLSSLDGPLLRLEQDPTNTQIIEEIFRAAHTFKGGAGMFGFKAIERVMHSMENLFDLIRKGKLVPTSHTIDATFQGMDLLRVLLEAVRAGRPCGAKTADVVRNLILASQGKELPAATPASAAAPSGSAASAPAASAAPAPQAAAHAPAAVGAEASAPAAKAGAAAAPGREAAKKEPAAIRVDLERLDALVNLVGELVTDRTRFLSLEEDIRASQSGSRIAGTFAETLQLFGRHMNEIQDIIMKVRMVPVGTQFNRYTRIVRDLAKQLGKRIELVITGEATELDKTIVEQIGDPLIHLIRNSCDHGVELPDVRAAAGKDPTGKIRLSAVQEGNQILITIEDDGKGIPVDVIRRKAIEKGLITENDVLADKEIFALIFEPGFSTAEKVTEISGRGVGMDVVKKQIQKLKGQIDIDSKLGQGTRMTIRLPLTLAIVQSLLVEADHDVYAIPLATVSESIRIEPSTIQLIGGEEVVRLRDRVLPLVRLRDVLGLQARGASLAESVKAARSEPAREARRAKREKIYVVVCGSPAQPFGIVVDKLLNQTEMVIKSMGPLMQNIPCVAGGALLGAGDVVVVLDTQELEARFRSKNRGKHAA